MRETKPETDSLRQALERQEDDEAPDRSLIIERLAWNPEPTVHRGRSSRGFYGRRLGMIRIDAVDRCSSSRRRA